MKRPLRNNNLYDAVLDNMIYSFFPVKIVPVLVTCLSSLD